MTAYLGASLTLLLAFVVFIVKDYIRDLRRENAQLKREVDTAWRLYESDHRELCAMKGQHVSEPYFPPSESESDQPFPRSGIGPTAIRDREFRKQQQEKEDTQPRFDKSTLAKPTESEIIAAAKKATDSVN